MDKVSSFFNHILCEAKKHSSEILIGIGISGMVGSTILGISATPKALMRIDKKKKELKKEKLTKKETIKTVATCYIPTIVTSGLSIACLFSACSINAKRNAALLTAYTISESTLKDYQNKVVETLGEKKENLIKDSIAKDKLEQNPVNQNDVIVTGTGNTLCYDAVIGRYFYGNRDKIDKAVNELNRRMRSEMYISLNELYYELRLDSVELGDDLGWNINTGYIELVYSYQGTKGCIGIPDGTPCLVISYLICPRYDYTNLH